MRRTVDPDHGDTAPSGESSAAGEEHPPAPPPSPPLTFASSPERFVSSPWDLAGPSRPHAAVSPNRCLATITKRCGRILSLAVSDDGLLYAGTESKVVRVWKHPGFFEISQLKSGSGMVEALHVSSSDGLVFSAHGDGKVRVWSSKPFHVRKGTLPSSKDFMIEACRSRTQRALTKISAGLHHPYAMFGGSGDKLKHNGAAVTGLAFDPAAKLLYSAASDGTVKVWSTTGMRCLETVRAHDSSVNALAVGPRAILFSGSDDCTVRLWQRSSDGKRSHRLLSQADSQGSPVMAVAVSAEEPSVSWGGREVEEGGCIVYAGCSDGCVRYWKKGGGGGGESDDSEMAYLGRLRGHSHAVLCLANVEKLVVSGSVDASIRVWKRLPEGLGQAAHECVAILCSHIGPVKALAATVEEEAAAYLVYSGSLDGSVKQWRIRREVHSAAAP